MAVKRTNVELVIGDSELGLKFLGASKPKGRPGRGQFRFQLCSKDLRLGGTSITQWWMDSRSLYPDRGRRPAMFRSIVDYFQARASREGTTREDDVAESILLAQLLPHVRSHGSRRVFADAIPKGLGSTTKAGRTAVAELQNLLEVSRGKTLDFVQFRDQTAGILGPPEYDVSIRARYREMAEELLGDGRRALDDGGSGMARKVREIWERWTKKIGRRRGREDQKRILDVISFESRAAFHRCYSALWHDLIYLMAHVGKMSELSARFHSLWQIDRTVPAKQPGMACHLFHGHIFGLHPAGAQFIQTVRGRELLEGWVKKHESKKAFDELLFGLSVAVFQYSDTREEQKISRRPMRRRRLD